MNSKDFLLYGIYSTKGPLVRNQFKECIELICEKVTKNAGERPLFYVIKVLKSHFPSQSSSIGTQYSCEFFNIFSILI